LPIFVTVFFGSMSLGSLVWGQTASLLGIPHALLAAAAGALATMVLTRRFPLQAAAGLDLAPSMHWPPPLAADTVGHDRGPVMVTVQYRIDPTQRQGFHEAMQEVGRERRRDGAYAWGLFEDATQPGRYLEYFLVASWLEHLRQHERVTRADQDQQARARAFHLGPDAPQVEHFLAPDGEQA